MISPRRRDGREFKLEVVRRVQETGRSQAQVAKEFGISANTLGRWIRQFRAEQNSSFPGFREGRIPSARLAGAFGT